MSASNWREIQRSEVAYLKEIDSNIKNGFRWAWLEEKDCNDNFLSDYIRKVNIQGKFCVPTATSCYLIKVAVKTTSKNTQQRNLIRMS